MWLPREQLLDIQKEEEEREGVVWEMEGGGGGGRWREGGVMDELRGI